MKLFLPEKYPVIIGSEKSSVGFCSVWNQADIIAKAEPLLLEKAAIIGTLYSRQGVNVILRNLALNPQIKVLALWGFGPLSNTPFGTSGTNILRAFFENGVSGDSVVIGTSFQLESELDLGVLETVRQNVELLDMSDSKLEDIASLLPDISDSEAYMKPVSFALPEAREIATLPSEGVGFSVRGATVIDAWQKLVFNIMRYGTVKGSQYGMEQRELIGLQWTVYDEGSSFPDDIPSDWPDDLRETVGVTKEAISQYHDVFLSASLKEGVTYTYGSRLRNWALGEVSVDQVADGLIENLKNSPDSRRAVATTLIPPMDTSSKSPPCLISVQCLQSGGKLHMLATFRSHDIFKAAIPNAFGLIALHEEVARETGFLRGSLCIESHSAHIYESDFDQAEKLINCSYIGREPSIVFDAENADKRGNLIIKLNGDLIIAEHQTPDGHLVAEYSGRNTREVMARIAHLSLISQIAHALDVGAELQKAETALKLGIEYLQDKDLPLSC